ncbi:DeoR/GlpR family DNA-binding transcription regulator [Liquorilactobacillus uvarum]|uniref:DeoR/GlpR family DNA-binding transcription regulator n=1 Tax=Liquorilactobacillus uvarum TaxID=303240 RepID=UPI002889B611|nr:DeoR/GlpR family DNA-binding transcription regulator [Liquorilactobacillus uvarum]
MLAEERQQVILSMLKTSSVVKLQDICKKVTCSESSVRRDLQLLEEKGLLIRVHGGAKVKHSLQRELDMTGKSLRNVQQKSSIAKFAAEQIQDEDVVYLDAGTSTLAMIQFLHSGQRLTVVTNGVVHASALADRNIRTILVGGELKTTTKAIVGIETVNSLHHYRFNKAFLGTNGVHPRFGYTTPDPDEAAVKKTALDQSEKNYILADESKIDQVSFVKVAELAKAIIITNRLPKTVLDQYSDQTTIQEVSI